MPAHPDMATVDIDACFSSSYSQARDKFLAAVQALDGAIEHYRNAEVTGPEGEALYADVARFGPADAARVLIVTSGTHGIEGYCGSGCQVAFLRSGAVATLPADTRLVLVHAVNPYGFAHKRRVNEDNIDLNRNFIDHAQGHPDSAAYTAIHPIIAPADYGTRPEHWDAQVLEWIKTHGMEAFVPAVSGGQYAHRDGLFYGGAEASWSNAFVRELVAREAKGAQAIRLLDIHTGLGPFGDGEKIGLGGAHAVGKARDIWGEDVTDLQAGDSVSAAVSGDVGTALFEEAAPLVPSTGAIAGVALEFGTVDPVTVLKALRFDNWLYMHAGGAGAELPAIKQRMCDAFYPDDPAWRKSVVEQTLEAISQGVNAS